MGISISKRRRENCGIIVNTFIMCYEFIHSCDNTIKNVLDAFVPANTYFLVCIGDINYIYCNNIFVKARIASFFKNDGIQLYSLPVDEMISVIDFPTIKGYQTFHGNHSLLLRLRKQLGVGEGIG